MGVDIRICTEVTCTECWYSYMDGKYRHRLSGKVLDVAEQADDSFDAIVNPDYPHALAGLKVGMLYLIRRSYWIDAGSYVEFDVFMEHLHDMSAEHSDGDDFYALPRSGIIGPVAASFLLNVFCYFEEEDVLDEYLSDSEVKLYRSLREAFGRVVENGAILIE